MAQDGHKQPLGIMTAPARTDGPGGDDSRDSALSVDVPVSAPAGPRQADPSGRYVSHAAPALVPAEVPASHAAAPAERHAARIEVVEAASYLTATISASAVRHNLALLRGMVDPGVEICAAVKADCYGHGIDVLWEVIASGADALAVATAAEALHLRELGYAGPVLMLFPPGPHAPADLLAELLAADIQLTVVSAEEVLSIARVARLHRLTAGVHVKVDTGMSRGGMRRCDAPSLVRRIRTIHRVTLRGLYTHLACADEADKSSAWEQMRCFDRAAYECGTRGLVLHAANSAAVIDMPSTHLHMVRPGIAVYGYQSSDQMLHAAPLRPALRVTGRLVQVKDVAAGTRCGYGQTYRFESPGRTGLVPVGYADGYRRCFSNRAQMRIAGRDVPVRGRVSMDQTIVDLTDVPQAREGDEVEIISPNASDPHSVESLARLAGTIPYEITCGLGSRVKRMTVD